MQVKREYLLFLTFTSDMSTPSPFVISVQVSVIVLYHCFGERLLDSSSGRPPSQRGSHRGQHLALHELPRGTEARTLIHLSERICHEIKCAHTDAESIHTGTPSQLHTHTHTCTDTLSCISRDNSSLSNRSCASYFSPHFYILSEHMLTNHTQNN